MFCNYKEIFGKPNEGFHSARIGPFASNDLIGTIILSILLSFLMNWSFIFSFIILMIVAISMHKLFCVNTALNNMIF